VGGGLALSVEGADTKLGCPSTPSQTEHLRVLQLSVCKETAPVDAYGFALVCLVAQWQFPNCKQL
jgi:hypothetical protein